MKKEIFHFMIENRKHEGSWQVYKFTIVEMSNSTTQHMNIDFMTIFFEYIFENFDNAHLKKVFFIVYLKCGQSKSFLLNIEPNQSLIVTIFANVFFPLKSKQNKIKQFRQKENLLYRYIKLQLKCLQTLRSQLNLMHRKLKTIN